MGAEGEEEKAETKPNPISEAQFVSWKRRKVGSSVCILLSYSSWIRSFHLPYCRPIPPKLIENVPSAFAPKIYIEINEAPAVPLTRLVAAGVGLLDFFLLTFALPDAEASARKAEAARKRSEDIAAGTVQMNGWELFLHEPWVFDNTNY